MDVDNSTEPPLQNVVGPFAVIIGIAGLLLTVTIIPTDIDVQLPPDTATVYVPLLKTVIDLLVEPFDHKFPSVYDEVNITESPEQNVVGPFTKIVGIVGLGFTVTTVVLEGAEEQFPFETVTE